MIEHEGKRNLIQNQSIVALAYEPESGLIFGGAPKSPHSERNRNHRHDNFRAASCRRSHPRV